MDLKWAQSMLIPLLEEKVLSPTDFCRIILTRSLNIGKIGEELFEYSECWCKDFWINQKLNNQKIA